MMTKEKLIRLYARNRLTNLYYTKQTDDDILQTRMSH
jgi:hypothetical protein